MKEEGIARGDALEKSLSLSEAFEKIDRRCD